MIHFSKLTSRLLTTLASAATVLAMGVATPALAQAPKVSKAFAEQPSGEYVLDRAHASVTWRVMHLGLSQYTARFDKMDGKLDFRAGSPTSSSVEFTIEAASINTGLAPFNKKLMGAEWFDGEKNPTIRFVSTKFESVGGDKYRLSGDITLRGVTKPMTWDVVFNGGMYNSYAQAHAIGFSAKGLLKRSDFGMKELVPMIGDDVEVLVEVEFNNRPKAS